MLGEASVLSMLLILENEVRVEKAEGESRSEITTPVNAKSDVQFHPTRLNTSPSPSSHDTMIALHQKLCIILPFNTSRA